MNRITINGQRFDNVQGDVFIQDGQVIVGKQPLVNIGQCEIRWEGDLTSLHTDQSVVCRNVHGNVRAGGSVSCDDIGGDVSAGGSVSCDDVQGNVRAGGSVNCDTVRGAVVMS